MPSSKRITKIAVLSGFIILLVAFIAYRSGAFDHYLYKKPAKIVESTPFPPEHPVQIDSFYIDIMQSTKSAPVMFTLLVDTSKDKSALNAVQKSRKTAAVISRITMLPKVFSKNFFLMSGSKSGRLILVPAFSSSDTAEILH